MTTTYPGPMNGFASSLNAPTPIDNAPFERAAAQYEAVIAEIHAIKADEGGHRTALGILKGEIEALEASWVYADNIYGQCKNEKERDAVLIGARRQDAEWQRLRAEVVAEEQGVQRAVRDRELAEDTRTICKRRMEMAIATRQLEAAAHR